MNRQMVEAMLGITRSGAWLITRNLLDDDDNEGVGVSGPSGADEALLTRLRNGEGRRFRMLDGDDIPYYEGRILYPDDVSDDSGPGSEDDFAPLWDFGEGNAGCTTIEYWEPGKGGGWKTL